MLKGLFCCVVIISSAAVEAETRVTTGQSLAAGCVSCHATGVRNNVLIPLVGMDKQQLLQKLANFKSGAMPSTVMQQITKGYTDDQLRHIADWFAAQKKPLRE